MEAKEQFIEDFIEIPMREDAIKQLDLIIKIELDKKLSKIGEILYNGQEKD